MDAFLATMQQVLDYLHTIKITDLIDIAIISYIFYKIILFAKETRAGQVLRGIGGTADAFGPELIRRLTCETQIDAPAPLTGLDARPVRFGGCVDRTQMLHTVDEFLK